MPRYREPENPTPFARVLIDYMWSQRPPLSAGQLAVKLGNISRQTVHSWLYEGKTPSISNALDALDRLGIPLQLLLDAYEQQEREQEREQQEIQTTEQPAKAKTSFTRGEKREFQTPPLDVWMTTIERTERAMREMGMEEQVIAAVVQRIREQQEGKRPMQRHIEAEHADPPSLTTPLARDAGSPGDQDRAGNHKPARRKTPSPSGPRTRGNGNGDGNGGRDDNRRGATD